MKSYIICCDWGTTSFRLRLVDKHSYNVIAEFLSDDGVAALYRLWQEQSEYKRFDFYAARLRGSILKLTQIYGRDLKNVPVIVSGMASSTLGMDEIPYAALPFNISGKQASFRIFENFNGIDAPLILVSGIRSHEDVMRGEEAQLIGLLKLNEISIRETENAVFVFPGTHSKHIVIAGGFVSDFHTFMTGELFNILAEHSILKDSITANSESGLNDQSNISAFNQGIEVSGTSSLLHTLFTIRTAQLFSKFSKEQNSYYLSGLLIGTELRELNKGKYDQMIICSGKNLYDHYKLAAEAILLNTKVVFIQPDLIDKATIAGQVQIFNALQTIQNE